MDESNIHLSCVFSVFFFPAMVTQMYFPLDSSFPPRSGWTFPQFNRSPLSTRHNLCLFAKKTRNYLLSGLTGPEGHFQRLSSNGFNMLKSNHGEPNDTHAKQKKTHLQTRHTAIESLKCQLCNDWFKFCQ